MIICVNLTPQFMATMKLEMNINFSVPVSCIKYEWTVFILTYFQYLVHFIGHFLNCPSLQPLLYKPAASNLALSAVFSAESSLIAFTRTGTKCSPLYFKCSSCSLSMITLSEPSNSRMSWAINPYLCWPDFSSVSLDFLNQKLTGSNLFTKSKPCGTVPKSTLSLLSEVEVNETLPVSYTHLTLPTTPYV